jgi:hypothetical protein
MTKPMVRIYTSTDEFIDREMNKEEYAQYQIDKAAEVARQVEIEEKAVAKAELLDRLGITADEAKLLLS